MQVLFVDRKKEIAEITSAMKKLIEKGEGTVFLITGEPGVGKTSLLAEVGKIAEEHGIQVLQERCIPENKTPYGVFRAIVKKGYDALMRKEATEEMLPLALAVGQDGERIERERVVSEQYSLLENLYRNLVEISKLGLCLLVDDLQWADSGSISFIHYLARNISRTRIILICTASDVEVANETLERTVKAMNVEKILKILPLKNLSYEDTTVLIKNALKAEIPEKLLKQMYNKTSGNPLFILEILEGIKTRMDALQLESITIPQTLSAAYQKRLKAVEKDIREVMGMLAVIGREFSFEDACAVLHRAEEEILDAIEKMMGFGFLAEKGGAEERYVFLNNPVYEILYSTVPKEIAIDLHKRIAEHFIASKNREEYYEEIAWHLRNANQQSCVEYYLKSAFYYLKNFAIDDSIRTARLALEYGEKFKVSDSVKAEIYKVLACGMSVLANFDEACKNYEKALHLSRDEKEQAEIILHLAKDYTKIAKYDEALAILKELPASSLENPEIKGETLFVEGTVFMKRGYFKECLEKYEEALKIIKMSENKKLEADLLNSLGVVYQSTGNYAEAEKSLLEAYQIRNELGNVREIAISSNNLGLFYVNTGHPEKALPYLVAAEKIYNKIGDVYGLSIVINNLGVLHWSRGEYSLAIEYFKKEGEYTSKIGDRSGTGYALYNIGTLYDEMGEIQLALDYYSEAASVFEAIGERSMSACALAGKACMLAAKGEHQKAEEIIAGVFKEIINTPNSDDIAVVKMMYARVLTYAGKYAMAEEFFMDVIDYFESQDKIGDLATAYTALAKLYILSGDREKAKEALNTALGIAQKIDSPVWKEKIKELFDEVEAKERGER